MFRAPVHPANIRNTSKHARAIPLEQADARLFSILLTMLHNYNMMVTAMMAAMMNHHHFFVKSHRGL